MNKTIPRSLRRQTVSRRGGAKGVAIAVVVLVLGVVAWRLPATQALIGDYLGKKEGEPNSKYILHKAEVGSFRITITENGTVDSSSNSTLTNSVEGSTTIISLVPEGSKVNAPVVAEVDGVVEFVDVESESEKTVLVRPEEGEPKTYTFPMGEFTELLVKDRQQIKKGEYIAGDMVCELDSSTLVEKEKQQQIDVTTARADLEKAETNLQIQETTNESVEAQARLAEKLAELDFTKYTAEGGEFRNQVEQLNGDIKALEETLAINQENYEKVRDQARRGYTNLNALEAARIEVTKQQILVSVKESELKLLQNFTWERTKSELEQMKEDTVRETTRAILEGKAAMAGLKADVQARKLTLSVEEEKLERTLRQIKACRLIAPQQGEVVYASQESRRSEPVVIEEGATVRERQAIINLPDLEKMKIDARIHESRISRVMLGQPVEISIDALPSTTFHGVLETISSVPVPGSWPNTDLKEYEAGIKITDRADTVRQLKPGMTAEIRIIVDDRQEDVLQIPVQSVLSIANKFFTYVAKGSEIERRELKVGDANDEYMEIIDGVAEGERVVMNPRTHFSREINELEVKLLGEQEDNRERTVIPNRSELGPAGGGGGRGAGRPGGGQGNRGEGKDGADKGKADGQQAERPAGGGPPGGGAGGAPDPSAIFARLDKNGDGSITKDESDMRGNFDKTDADGDGKITIEELKTAFSQR